MLKLDSLPVLASGSHKEGSGYACIMNAVSYLNGDSEISDMPGCVYRPLAHLAQAINDNNCGSGHPGYRIIDEHKHLHQLCPSCTHEMWLFGAELIGTAEAVKNLTGQQQADLIWDLAATGWEVIHAMGISNPVSQQIVWAARHRTFASLAIVASNHAVAVNNSVPDFAVTMANHLLKANQEMLLDVPWADPDNGELITFTTALTLFGYLPFTNELRMKVAYAIVDRFAELTLHSPVYPTQGEVDRMSIKAGLVAV